MARKKNNIWIWVIGIIIVIYLFGGTGFLGSISGNQFSQTCDIKIHGVNATLSGNFGEYINGREGDCWRIPKCGQTVIGSSSRECDDNDAPGKTYDLSSSTFSTETGDLDGRTKGKALFTPNFRLEIQKDIRNVKQIKISMSGRLYVSNAYHLGANQRIFIKDGSGNMIKLKEIETPYSSSGSSKTASINLFKLEQTEDFFVINDVKQIGKNLGGGEWHIVISNGQSTQSNDRFYTEYSYTIKGIDIEERCQSECTRPSDLCIAETSNGCGGTCQWTVTKNTNADTNCDNGVGKTELISYGSKWLNGQVSRTKIGQAIVAWVGG